MNTDSKAKELLSGLAFGESPRWHDDRLWFSNWTVQEVVAVDLDGKSEVVVRLPFQSFPFSIDWLPDGRLLIVSATEGLLVREADGSLIPYAVLGDLGHHLNEIVVDGRGNVYLNGSLDPRSGENIGAGVVLLVSPDGKARQVAEGIIFPNGMAVTPDNKTLIVADSFANKLVAFDIARDGSLSKQRVWADLVDGAPDGICIDAEGAVWYADVPNQHCVRVREGGEILEIVAVDRGCFACMLGGPDRKTLCMMAAEWHGFEHMVGAPRTGQVLTAETTVAGAGWPAAQ